MSPACPECSRPLLVSPTEAVCEGGHRFPVRQNVPVLLVASEGWDAATQAAEFETLYQQEAEPWNYTGSGAERLKYAFLATEAGRLAPGSGATVADVGCSLGAATWTLARQGFDVLGLDLSPTAIARARQGGTGAPVSGRADFVVASATRLPLGTSSCDLVLLSDGLRSWHLSAEQIRSCLAETHRALRPGGTAIFLDYMHRRHFDAFVDTIAASPLQLQEVQYLDDRLFYKLEGWARKLGLRDSLSGLFANEDVARKLAAVSRLAGRRGSKHICVIARKAR